MYTVSVSGTEAGVESEVGGGPDIIPAGLLGLLGHFSHNCTRSGAKERRLTHTVMPRRTGIRHLFFGIRLIQNSVSDFGDSGGLPGSPDFGASCSMTTISWREGEVVWSAREDGMLNEVERGRLF